MTLLESLLPGLMAVEHFHPLLVHFPIVLLFAAFVVQVLGHFNRRKEALFPAARWLLYSGTVLACPTVITGFIAAGQLGHDTPGHELVHIHRNWMIVTSAAAIVVSGVAWLLRQRTSLYASFSVTTALFFLCIGLTLGADRGAFLVYRYGHGVSTTPRADVNTPRTSETIPDSSDREESHHGHNQNDHQH